MYCNNCGRHIPKDSKYCRFCGSKTGMFKLEPKEESFESKIAPSDRRLINFILDTIFSYLFVFIFAFIFGVALVFLGFDLPSNDNLYTFLSIISPFLYYFSFESLWQRTPAKLITKTIVVDQSGEVPTTKQIFLRTLSRFVPFEAFSFFGKYPVGWHDKWSGTRVILVS